MFILIFSRSVQADELKLGEWHMIKNNSWWPPDLKICQEIAQRLNNRNHSNKDILNHIIAAPVSSTNVQLIRIADDEDKLRLQIANHTSTYSVSDSIILQLNTGFYRTEHTLLAAKKSTLNPINLKADYLICGNPEGYSEDQFLSDCRTAFELPLSQNLPTLHSLPSVDIAWVETPVSPPTNERPDYLSDYQSDALIAVTSSMYFESAPDSPISKDQPQIHILKLKILPDRTTLKDRYHLSPLTCTIKSNNI